MAIFVVEGCFGLRGDGFGRISRNILKSGKKITGIDEAEQIEGVKVFHAGTSKRDGGFLHCRWTGAG